MTTFLITFVAMLILIAMIAIRIIAVDGGEFRGTCSTNNEYLQREGESCPVCGNEPGDVCTNKESIALETGSSPTSGTA